MSYNSERPEVLTHLGRSTTRDIRSIDMPRKNATREDVRLYILENIEPVTESGCWLWMKAVDVDGYGLFHVQGKMRRVHRVSYELFNGPIPNGMHVCHRCDVPGCCNPSHLWVGTNSDNAIDRCRKGRHGAKGDRHGCAKLTSLKVAEIRKKYASGLVRQQDLADEYGVGRVQILRIVNNQNWKVA